MGIQVQPCCCGFKEIFISDGYYRLVNNVFTRRWHQNELSFFQQSYGSWDIDGSNRHAYYILRSSTSPTLPSGTVTGSYKICRSNVMDNSAKAVLFQSLDALDWFTICRVYNKTRYLFFHSEKITGTTLTYHDDKEIKIFRMNLDTGVVSTIVSETWRANLNNDGLDQPSGYSNSLKFVQSIVQDTLSGLTYYSMLVNTKETPGGATSVYGEIWSVDEVGGTTKLYDGRFSSPKVVVHGLDINYHTSQMVIEFEENFAIKYGVANLNDLSVLTAIYSPPADFNSGHGGPQVDHTTRKIWFGLQGSSTLPLSGLNSMDYDGSNPICNYRRSVSNVDFRNHRLSGGFLPFNDLM